MKISNFSIKRPVFTLVTMLLVIILGVVSFTRIPLKLIPEINPPVAVVVTSYPGAGPQEVLDKVSKPLEQNLSTVPGLNNITSTSQEGASLILMEFSWDTDVDEIQTDVMQRIDQTSLPDDAGNPRYLKFDPSQFPIIQLSLRGEEDEDELQKLASDLETELSRVEGIASVSVYGSPIKDVFVSLDQEKLKEYRLTQDDIVNVIAANDISLPGETVISGEKQLTTRVISTIDSIDTLKALVITKNPMSGEDITIADVADVQIEKRDQQTITRTNETPSVILSILQKSDSNTVQVSNAFKNTLDDLLNQDKYKNITADIILDQGEYIQTVIDNILQSLVLGGIFAMLVLFFFLRGLRSPIIIAVAIPYSVIVSFVLIYFADFTLNIMTLGGLALGIGMLVDNSIVVIENIYRHLSMGKDPKQASRDATKEVGSAIIASTLTTIAVFFPVVFIEGLIGDLFKEFSFTIAFSLLASLFVALTVVPMMASRMLKTPKENIEEKRQRSRFLTSVERLVKWSLAHRLAVLTIAFLFVVGSLFGLTKVGTQFLPNSDEGYFTIQVQLENGTSLAETESVVEAIEKELKDEDAVDVYVSMIGSTQMQAAQGTTTANTAEIYVKMKDLSERDVSVFEFTEEKQKDFERAAQKENSSAELTMGMQSSTGLDPNTLSFTVTDSNPSRLEESAELIYEELKDMKHVTEITTDLTETVEEIQISIDREKAFENGFVPSQIAMIVNNVTRGVTATNMVDDQSDIFEVKVEYDEEITRDIDQLKNLLIRKNDGTFVKLSDLAEIKIGESPVNIQRMNQQSVVSFTLKYSTDVSLGKISKEVDGKIADLDLPDETQISYSGEREYLDSALNDLFLALALAILFVYIVMAAQFESFKYPFVIMFTVPLMVVGVAIALIITNTPVSIMAFVGIIVLAGIVVNNAIVIVDYINKLKQRGMKSYDAIVQAVKDRLRPVLMTALTTILGLIPLSLGLGEGTEMTQPLGIAVIGGLLSSTLLTLVVIPVIYSLFDKETRHLNRKYRMPDGQIIPAYLLEDRVVKEEEEKHTESNLAVKKNVQKEDLIFMLEHLANLLKDENQKKDEDGEENRQ
ncbi:efflux RND transporter permease subunit [Fervidibacillus halotolerans]|uniref:Efflux RND transporter permease subunit n=1 Tax=Fervidibacillus halotolerans TaxID=2980027 RepID=A0A9E8M3G0_9BACI|nr:efflux RND transporter permease subunit [Fervidibacillus halotolerans]WAA13871.1 efflux RND transporter permease subunit [Fervidibacillus halotolerans]